MLFAGPQTAKAQRSTITKALNDEMAHAMMILHDRIDNSREPTSALFSVSSLARRSLGEGGYFQLLAASCDLPISREAFTLRVSVRENVPQGRGYKKTSRRDVATQRRA